MPSLSPEQTNLIGKILGLVKGIPPVFPAEPEFRVEHLKQRGAIDELLALGALVRSAGHYVPTLHGLRALGTEEARGAIRRCNALLELLKTKVKQNPRKGTWTPAEISEGSTFGDDDVKVFLTILLVGGYNQFASGWGTEGGSALVTQVTLLLDAVLDAEALAESEPQAATIPTGIGMIKRLYIHNFRSFVNFEWAPPSACVVVGENGAGKTALIEVLWLLQDLLVVGKAVDETTALSARTAWLSEAEQVIEIDVDWNATTVRYRLGVRLEEGRVAINEELRGSEGLLYRAESGKVDLFGDSPVPAPRATIPFDRKRSFIGVLEARPDNKRIMAFREAIRSIWAMQPDPRRIAGAAAAESRYLARNLSNFASWYLPRVAEDPDAAIALREDLKRVLVGFSHLRFEPISADAKDLRVRFSFGDKTHELGWSELSDGQRLLIALYGLLRFGLTKASLIALDEAENYVSPAEIQPFFRALVDAAAERKQQLLVVSHHPETINYLAADAAWRMWRDPASGHTRIAQIAPDVDAGETAYDAVKLGIAGVPDQSRPADG